MGCPIEYGRQPAATDRALYARCQRHALCQAQGFNSGDQFFAYLRDAFELLYAEGKTAPKMMSVGLHARLAGRLGRAAGLARFRDHVAGRPDVWICRRIDIARHWIEHHPVARTA
jgi:allantoinase